MTRPEPNLGQNELIIWSLGLGIRPLHHLLRVSVCLLFPFQSLTNYHGLYQGAIDIPHHNFRCFRVLDLPKLSFQILSSSRLLPKQPSAFLFPELLVYYVNRGSVHLLTSFITLFNVSGILASFLFTFRYPYSICRGCYQNNLMVFIW